MKRAWEYKKLGNVCNSELGKTLNQSKDGGELRPYLCAVNVLWDNIDTTILKEARFKDEELERYSVKKGDLLVCEGGDIGRAAIWDKEESIQYQNALHRVRFNDEVLSRFCLLYLRYLKEKGILDIRFGKGVTIKHLVKSALLSIPIPIPSLSEQESIVSELDLLATIIKKKNEQLKAYDQLAKAIFFDMFGDPIVNSKGWEVKKLGEVCESELGKTLNSTKDKGRYYPYLCAVNVLWNRIDTSSLKETRFEEEELERYSVKKGDLLVCEGGDIGRAAIWQEEYPIQYQNALHRLRFNDHIIPRYCLMFLQSLKEMGIIDSRYGKGVTIKHLVKSALLSIPIPIPPLCLQQQFAERVEAIERMKQQVQTAIKDLETLLASRMDYWFND